MKSKTFKIVGLISVILLLLLSYAIWQYNKPHLDVLTENPDYKTTVEQLLKEFQIDEFKATEKYADKVIQLKGTIFDISLSDGNSVITLKNNDQLTGILCNMNPEDNLTAIKLQKGELIEIKGICTGILLDVILVKCVIINNN